MITATDPRFATDALRDGELAADSAKALVMASLSGLVSSGHAQWRSLRNGDMELRLVTGEVFLLGDRSVVRTA